VARIAGLTSRKTSGVAVSLTYIYGIGRTSARYICEKTGVEPTRRVKDLTEDETIKIRNFIENEYKVEGALRGEVNYNIKRLMDVNCYRGFRHKRGLPVHGRGPAPTRERGRVRSRVREPARRSRPPRRRRSKALGSHAASRDAGG